MLYFTRFLLPAFLLCHLVATKSLDRSGYISNKRHLPSLTAVTVRSDIQKREERFIPRRDCEHHYVDHESVLRGDESRFATTSMKYNVPALTLEDIEMDVAEIQCRPSSIIVEFINRQTLEAARKSWDTISEFLIISSHPGCNSDGQRAPHLVSSIEYGDDVRTAIFSIQQLEWKDAFHSMTVSFGMSQGKYKPNYLRLHDSLRRRQVIPTTGLIFPSAPTATPTSSSVTKDISYQVPAGQQIFALSDSSDSLNVTCADCSIAGEVSISEGAFIVNGSSISGLQAVNFLEHGYFTAVANGVNAHVELDTSLSLSDQISFDNTILSLALPGFQIPGIAAIGLMFQLHLTGSIEIIAPDLNFTYGFDLTVPDNSSVLLNVGNITESTVNGFNDAQITAIPFTASSPDTSLGLGLGLKVELLLGVDILGGDGGIDAGVFIDLPSLSVNVSQVDGVNAECEPASGATTVNGLVSPVFQNLTHIVPQIEIDIGLLADAHLDIDELDVHTTIGTQDVLAGTTFALPTVCLMWDAEKSQLTTPTVSTTTSAGPIATGGGQRSSNSGIRSVNNPVPQFGAIWWSLGALLSVLFVAVSL